VPRYFGLTVRESGLLLRVQHVFYRDGPALFCSAKDAAKEKKGSDTLAVTPLFLEERWPTATTEGAPPKRRSTNYATGHRYVVKVNNLWWTPYGDKRGLVSDFNEAKLFTQKADAIAIAGMYPGAEVRLVKCADAGPVWETKKI